MDTTSHSDLSTVRKSLGELLDDLHDPPDVGGPAILPEEKQEQAYAMKLLGKSQQEIADHFKVNTSTIYRWQKQYEEQYRKRRESSPATDKVQEILMYWDHIIKTCIQAAGDCKKAGAELVERSKTLCMDIASKTLEKKANLLLETGEIPRTPERLFQVIADMRPPHTKETVRVPMTKQQAIEHLLEKIRYSTPDIGGVQSIGEQENVKT